MSEQIVKVNGVEYTFIDTNITSSEIGMASFSGYMAFNGSLSEGTLKKMAENYDKAINAKVIAGEITEAVGETMKKEYGSALMKLVGKRINAIFSVASGVITGAFDKNMNPDKSLDEIIVPLAIDYAAGSIGGSIGFWVGGIIGSAIGPVGSVAGAAIGSALGALIGSVVSSINSDDFYKTLKSIVVDKYNMVLEYDRGDTHYKFSNDELSLTCLDGSKNPFAFVDNKATIPSDFGCKTGVFINNLTQDKITVNYEQMRISLDTKDDESIKDGLDTALKIGGENLEQITINSKTYNIKELSNLQIRNALDFIPKVSFLLSNILIKVGEELDLGDKGIYKVKSNDTLSTIAQRNGMITKDLLKLNTWLLDENRVKFLQNKILVDTTLSESEPNNINHTLIGDSNAENLLIDANGGDNEFTNLSLVA